MTKFLVLAMPRSGSAWLSHWLAPTGTVCGHDQSRYWRTLADAKSWWEQGESVGSVETAIAPWWRLIPSDFRVLVVRRPIDDVLGSISRLGFSPTPEVVSLLRNIDRKLEQVALRHPQALAITAGEQFNPSIARVVWEHLLESEFDERRHAHRASINIQINFASMLKYMSAHREAMTRLAGIGTQLVLESMAKPLTGDLVIEHGTVDQVLSEGAHLLRSQQVHIGGAPWDYARKSLDGLRAFEQAGQLMVLIARREGKICGYLSMVLGDSLSEARMRTGLVSVFYATGGAATKLHSAAVEWGRGIGLSEIFWQNPTRVGAPDSRIDVLARRQGASLYGTLFRLRLKG